MISLRPMTAEEFRIYRSKAVLSFAKQLSLSKDLSLEDAEEASELTYQEILPIGLSTENMHLFKIVNQVESVGIIHLGIRNVGVSKEAYIWDIEIFEEFRRNGYAKAAITRAELLVKELGCVRLGLHVFGHNEKALSLYQYLGFQITGHNMVKNL